MDSAMHRHNISDHVWSLLAPLLPGRRGAWVGAKDNRLFVNAIFGFYGQALHGETFHRNMVAGKILIVVLSLA